MLPPPYTDQLELLQDLGDGQCSASSRTCSHNRTGRVIVNNTGLVRAERTLASGADGNGVRAHFKARVGADSGARAAVRYGLKGVSTLDTGREGRVNQASIRSSRNASSRAAQRTQIGGKSPCRTSWNTEPPW